MVIVPSQGLKGVKIRGGIAKIKIWKGIVFIDSQLKVPTGDIQIKRLES